MWLSETMLDRIWTSFLSENKGNLTKVISLEIVLRNVIATPYQALTIILLPPKTRHLFLNCSFASILAKLRPEGLGAGIDS